MCRFLQETTFLYLLEEDRIHNPNILETQIDKQHLHCCINGVEWYG